MVIRRLEEADRPALRALYVGLGELSRARRFGTPVPRWCEPMLEMVTDLAQDGHVALGAFLGGRLVGVVHLVHAGEPGTCEVAAVVADAHQGRGIGSALLQAAVTDATREHRRALLFHLSGDNPAMARLLARLGVRVRYRGGSGEAVLPLVA